MLSKHEEQAERLEWIENEKKLRNQGSTFSKFAESEATTPLGRFSAISSPVVVGSTPLPKYEGAPNWSPDPTGPEPPLNADVNALEPTGEPHELKASVEPEPLEPPLSAQAPPSASAPPSAALGVVRGAEGFLRTSRRA